MKKKMRVMAAVMAAVAAMSCCGVSAYADKIKNIDGIRYRYSDSGEELGKYTGWLNTSEGKKFCKDGEIVTNRWVKKKSGARFYLDASGIMLTGWVHLGTDWYYIDGQKGAFTGTQTVDGVQRTFDSKGRWDKTAPDGTTNWEKSYFKLVKKLDKKKYGVIYYCDEMCVVTSVDGQAEAAVAKLFPDGANVVFLKADYSMYEMEQVQEKLRERLHLWSGMSIMMDGRLHVDCTEEQKEKLEEYLATIDNSGCVVISITDGMDVDDNAGYERVDVDD